MVYPHGKRNEAIPKVLTSFPQCTGRRRQVHLLFAGRLLVGVYPDGGLWPRGLSGSPLGGLFGSHRIHMSDQPLRILGLRFLVPVLFVPYVEVTLAKAQMGGADHLKVMEIMGMSMR